MTPTITARRKQLWIDLASLVESSECNGEFASIYYQYSKRFPEPRHNTITYNLRLALRALGYKITKIRTVLHSDTYETIMLDYYTNIPKSEYDNLSKHWNEWTENHSTDECSVNDSDDDDDDDSVVSDSNMPTDDPICLGDS